MSDFTTLDLCQDKITYNGKDYYCALIHDHTDDHRDSNIRWTYVNGMLTVADPDVPAGTAYLINSGNFTYTNTKEATLKCGDSPWNDSNRWCSLPPSHHGRHTDDEVSWWLEDGLMKIAQNTPSHAEWDLTTVIDNLQKQVEQYAIQIDEQAAHISELQRAIERLNKEGECYRHEAQDARRKERMAADALIEMKNAVNDQALAQQVVGVEFERDAWRRMFEGANALIEQYQKYGRDSTSRLDF